MTSTPALTIGARDFLALVDGVVPFAGKDRGLPVLNTVRIESRGTHLLAMATDRYRLAVQRVAAKDGATWPEFEANIPLNSLRSIKTMFKPQRGGDSTLTLTINGDRLVVEADGALMEMLSAKATYYLEAGEFPKVVKIIQEAIDREPEASDFSLNPGLLGALVGISGPALVVKGHPSKPVLFSNGEDFIGIIMPRRYDGDSAASLADWKPLLSVTAAKSKPAAKKTAAKAKAGAAA